MSSDSNYAGIEQFVKALGASIEDCQLNLTEENFKLVVDKFNELSKAVFTETN